MLRIKCKMKFIARFALPSRILRFKNNRSVRSTRPLIPQGSPSAGSLRDGTEPVFRSWSPLDRMLSATDSTSARAGFCESERID